MKISLGLAACALLAAGLSASADPKPRFKQNGDPCTAEEVANPPVVKVRYKGQTIKWKVECRTEVQWTFAKAQEADPDRQKMGSNRVWFTVGDTHNTLADAPAGESRINGQ